MSRLKSPKSTEQPRLKQATSLEHMRNQTGMYLGGKSVITSREYRIDDASGTVRLVATQLSPACVKIMDEIVVNAVDQYTRFGADLYFTWDADGAITVVNTKSSFEIYDVTTEDGRRMSSVQMAFGEFRTSTNFDLSQESITGGMNGIGCKGVNAFSSEFEVEVYDPKSDHLLCMRWTRCMQQVETVESTLNPAEKAPFVRVTFRPNYEDFGMEGDSALQEQYRQLFYMRVLHTAAFCQGARVFWQDSSLAAPQLIKLTAQALVRRHVEPYFQSAADVRTVEFEMLPARGLQNRARFLHGADLMWRGVLAVKDNRESVEQFSIVNGLYVREGTHLDFLRDQIVEYCRPLWIELKDPSRKAQRAKRSQAGLAEVQAEIARNDQQKREAAEARRAAGKDEKARATARHQALVARERELRAQERELRERDAAQPKFDRRVIEKYLFIAIVGYINRPSFTGQRKDRLDSPQSQFAGYQIPATRLQEFWEMLRPLIEFDIFKGATRGTRGSAVKKIKCPHHKPAQYYATKNRAKASLIPCEGDSAAGTIDKMRGVRGSKINHLTHGLFILGGVTMNIQREISFRTNPKTGERVAILSERFRENERMQEFFQVLNLDTNRRYETAEERETLTYGAIDIATDQDEDGKGNIRSGVGNLFLTLWPALIRAGFVRFIRTPIVRAYHRASKAAAQEFYTEGDYRTWERALPEGEIRRWEVVYYKGLGSHGDEETANMARKYDRLLVTFTMDERSEAACRVYFGEDADLRKAVLVSPPRHTEEYYYREGAAGTSVSITNHFNTETKSYQIYNIARHILHRIDGRLPSRRKVLAGTRKMLGNKNARVKVFQLSGDIARKMGYHHGDASLNGNVMGETQDFPGAREFPMLLAISNSGSRKMGGMDAAAPRYAFTKYNQRLGDAIFPPADDYILDYVFDDGMRCEPTYYIPVVPMAILESYRSPGHGWVCTVWARCFWEVIAWTRECVERGWRRRDRDFAPTRNRFQDEIVKVKGVETSVGRYRRDGDLITITEMPRGVWNEHWLNGNPDNKKSRGVADEDWVTEPPLDLSTDREIHIELRCREGYLDSLPEREDMDKIVKLLDLKQSLAANLNFIDTKGAVVECESYTDVFDGWFQVRHDAYARRLERMRIIIRLRIKMAEEQLKFIRQRESLGLAKKKVDEQNKIIAAAGFARMDKALLDQPSFTRVEDLEAAVLGEAASWDYLRKMDADDLSEEGEASLLDRLVKLQRDLAEYTAEGALKKIWLHELAQLEAVVRQGQDKGWTSWEPKKCFAD